MTDIAAKFWPKVEKSNGCWRWTGAKSGGGYGVLYAGRRLMAHRCALELTGTIIPPGYVVDHICRVRDCVNPEHLRVVTPKQNTLENSMSPSALNKRKRLCVRGHPLTVGTIYHKPKGGGAERVCRLCHLGHMAAYRGRRRAERLARAPYRTPDSILAAAVASGMSLRKTAALYDSTLQRVRGAVLRIKLEDQK